MSAPRSVATAGRALGVAVVALAAIAVPLLLWRVDPPFIARTYARSYQPFELFGFTATLAFVGFAIALLRGRPERRLPLVALGAVWFHALGQIVEGSQPAWDWGCYQDAAGAVLSGGTLYGRGYLYPPLLAQALAFAYRWASVLLPGLAGHEATSRWHLIFYLYQCLQFALVVLTFALTWRLARRMGLPTRVAWLVIPALFVLDSPLQRTLRHDQINLWVLASVLAGILSLARRPFLAGLAVALGAHLKLIPIALLAPWTFARRATALLGAMVGAVVLLALETAGFREWSAWTEFFHASGSFRWAHAFRDNSLSGLIQAVAHVAGADGGPRPLFLAVYGVGAMAMLIWMAARFLERERLARADGSSAEADGGGPRTWLRLAGHSADALALTLVLAPVSWEHHYVLAIPIAAWAIAGAGRERPWAIGIAIALMLVVPTFDVFPFSAHRVAGLLLLLALTPPARLRPWREARTSVRPP